MFVRVLLKFSVSIYFERSKSFPSEYQVHWCSAFDNGKILTYEVKFFCQNIAFRGSPRTFTTEQRCVIDNCLCCCNRAFDKLLIPCYSAEESHSVYIFSCVIVLNIAFSMTYSEPIPACLYVISG